MRGLLDQFVRSGEKGCGDSDAQDPRRTEVDDGLQDGGIVGDREAAGIVRGPFTTVVVAAAWVTMTSTRRRGRDR